MNNCTKTPIAAAVTMRALSDIRLDPKNPRSHNKRQIHQIARSIDTFGFNVPILIDSANQVIAGHGRVLACQELGWTEVPTICLEHLSSAQAKAYMIADNKLTDNSSWDENLLAQSLKALSELDLDFELDAIGFEMAEIDLYIEQLDVSDHKDDEVVDLPAPNAISVSKLGDLWTLGEHRILCGNALMAPDYETLLAGRLVDMVFTDPPYNVPIAGHVMGNGRVQHREFAMAVGEMSVEQFTDFLKTVCTRLSAASTDGSIHFLCMDWRHLPEILAAGAAYTEFKNLCVWTKDNAGMGSLYRSQHELVLVFKNGTARHVNNVQLGQYGRYRTNIWKYPGINSFGRSTGEGNLLELHPTVKPVALIADALLDCSNRGDRVLDVFLGSGSTLIAAQRTGRVCFGMELDPVYVDTAIRRWQKHTGLKAVHALTGTPFDEVEALTQSAPTQPIQENSDVCSE
jgi:16S rRNA G966 N2-methylase RsmD